MTIRLYCFLWLVRLLIEGGYSPAAGQALYIGDQQRCYIGPDTKVSVRGNLQNQGTLIYYGTLSVSGDWQNRGEVVAQSVSKAILVGQDQRVDAQNEPFASLVIEGGGVKNLRSDTQVTDTLLLRDGIITAEPSASLTLASTASVAGGSDISYVSERMQYRVRGAATFPLGLDGQYLPIRLTDIVGTTPQVRIRVVSPNSDAIAGDQLARVSSARYWEIATTEGSLISAQATLTITAEDRLENLIGAVVAQAPEAGGLFTNAGQLVSTGNARRGSVTSEQSVSQPVVAVALTTEFSVADQVLIPSAFAPEGVNPENRKLRVYAANLLPRDFSFRIFDRWGSLVYEANSLAQARNEGWNGRYRSSGSPAPPGVYQYHVQGAFEGSIPVSKSGTITLFR